MALKFSLKQLLRTPVKTGLFILFLTSATVFLCFGLYMWVSVDSSLSQVANAFTTVGIIEYSPPQGIVISETDSAAIINSPHVEFFDHREWLPAYGAGIKPVLTGASATDIRVVVFELLEPPEAGRAPITILEALPTRPSWFFKQMQQADCSNRLLEPGKQYIAVGYYDDLVNAFTLVSPDFDPVAPVPGGDLDSFLAGPDGRPWAELLENLRRWPDTLTTLTTNDLEIVYAFHQGDAVVAKGRAFSPEDYKNAQGCLVSVDLAEKNGLDIGDKIDLTFYPEAGLGWRNDTGVIAHSNPLAKAIGTGRYEIIGLYSLPRVTRGDWYRLDRDTIIIPSNPALSSPCYVENNLVSCRLTNGTADAFLAEMEAAAIPGISITTYDQGYSKASNALTAMKQTALTLVIVCLSAGLVLSLLFALLYVSRQKHAVAAMYSLGASRRQALAFIAGTVCLAAFLAALLGALIGYGLGTASLNAVYQKLLIVNPAESAYSTAATGSAIQYQVAAPTGLGLPLLAAGIIIFMTLTASAAFAIGPLTAEPLQLLTAKED